jgi:hypothetical protein
MFLLRDAALLGKPYDVLVTRCATLRKNVRRLLLRDAPLLGKTSDVLGKNIRRFCYEMRHS